MNKKTNKNMRKLEESGRYAQRGGFVDKFKAHSKA